MTLKDINEFPELSDEEVSRLFDRFSLPIERQYITLAKVFWLRLITGTDTYEHICQDIKALLGNYGYNVAALFCRRANISIISTGDVPNDDDEVSVVAVCHLYFSRMKGELTEDEIRRLQNYFSHEVNFNRLRGWEPSKSGWPPESRQ